MLIFLLVRHLAFFYVLVGLHSDNPGSVYPDIGARSEEDPSAEDQTYLEEQASLQ